MQTLTFDEMEGVNGGGGAQAAVLGIGSGVLGATAAYMAEAGIATLAIPFVGEVTAPMLEVGAGILAIGAGIEALS